MTLSWALPLLVVFLSASTTAQDRLRDHAAPSMHTQDAHYTLRQVAHSYNRFRQLPRARVDPVTSYDANRVVKAALHRERKFVGEWLGVGADLEVPVTSGPAGDDAHSLPELERLQAAARAGVAGTSGTGAEERFREERQRVDGGRVLERDVRRGMRDEVDRVSVDQFAPVSVQRIRLQRQESPQERQLEALLRDPIKLQSLRNMPKMAPPPPAEE